MEEEKVVQEASVEETASKKKSLNAFIQDHPKTVFWTRFVLWALLAAILPFLFIAFRFGIFKKVSDISVSGWCILGIIIVVAFAFYLVRCLRVALKGRSPFFLQIVNGLCKIVIPLLCLYFFVDSLQGKMVVFEQALIVVIVCETLAIPINPMPVWVDKMNKGKKEEDRKDGIGYLWDEFFSRKKKHEGE